MKILRERKAFTPVGILSLENMDIYKSNATTKNRTTVRTLESDEIFHCG